MTSINPKAMFSRGLAQHEAFCNRVAEVATLTHNIQTFTHTLLTSPRRYGKTSLSFRAIEQIGWSYAYLDFFMKQDDDEILNEFYEAVGKLVTKILPPGAKVLRKIELLFKNLSVSLKLGNLGFEIALMPKTKEAPQEIRTLFESLDALLIRYNQKVVFFIDEIQAILDAKICPKIEAGLRWIAQKTKNISFVFSGSNRHLIGKIFEDKSRPLYKLCRPMSLTRISPSHYKPFINKFAKKNWGKPLSEEVLESIFSHTELHPYYMNIVCAYLFEQKTHPTVTNVFQCWTQVCQEEQASIAKDVEFLTVKQKKLLLEIAKSQGLKRPSAKHFVQKADLTPRGSLNAIKILLRHDLIEKNVVSEICIVDPVLKYWLLLS